MLINCPECGVEVSEKAPTCPKCGAIIAYPAFYTVVERDGLNMESLLCDWWNEFLDDSALGSLRPIQCLVGHTDDQEMVELTWTNGRKLADAMQNRVAQLPQKSKEANELELTAKYVQASCQFANLIRWCFHRENTWSSNQIRSEVDSILRKLEIVKSSCKSEKDIKLVESEFEECKKFGAKILAGRTSTPDAASPNSLPKGSGCLSVLILLIVLIVAVTYTAIATIVRLSL